MYNPKNKNMIRVSLFLVIGILVGLIGGQKAYGSFNLEGQKVVVTCEYNWNKISLEGRLSEERKYSSLVDGYITGILLDGNILNIIEPLEGREISWCKSEELNIEDIGNRIVTLTEVDSKFKFIAKAGCPFSGYVSFFKIKFGDEESSDDEGSSKYKYVFVPARCVDINNPYEILKNKGIIENSVLFKVDDEKTHNLDWIISS